MLCYGLAVCTLLYEVTVAELDPDKREWEYDGTGAKIYKPEAGHPIKTPYTELDGGAPLKRNWVNESNENSSMINDDIEAPSRLEIKVKSSYCNRWPQLTVTFNDNDIFSKDIIEKENIVLKLNHQSKNTLKIGLSNKSFGTDNVWDTQTDHDGNIIADLNLILEDVLVDDVSIIDILVKNMYFVDNTSGQPIQNEKIFSAGTINFNGFFSFEYSLPLLNSIINQKFKVPLDSSISYFSNYTKTFHYEDDLRIIKEIESILHETKKLGS